MNINKLTKKKIKEEAFKYLLLFLLILAIILEFLSLYKFEIRGSGSNFVEKIDTYLDNSILLLLLAMLGIIQVVEHVIGIKNELINKITARIVFVLFIIFLILIYTSSCSYCFGQVSMGNQSSIISDYTMAEQNYKLNISDFNKKDFYDNLVGKSKLQIEQSIHLMDQLYENNFVRRTKLRGGESLKNKLNDFSNRLESIDQIISEIDKSELQLKLYNFKYIFGLVGIDCYLRNYKNERALQSDYQIDFRKYYDLLFSDINDLDFSSYAVRDSISILCLGSLKNIEGILFSLYYKPTDFLQVKMLIANKVEELFDMFIQEPDTLIHLEKDSFVCKSAIEQIDVWLQTIEKGELYKLQSKEVTLENSAYKFLKNDKTTLIFLDDPQIKNKLLLLRNELSKADTLIQTQLKSEKISFDNYKSLQYRTRQIFLKSLFTGEVNFNIFKKVFENTEEYEHSKIDKDSIVHELDILELKVDSIKNSDQKLDSLYKECKKIFDSSYINFERLDLSRHNNYKGYILSCMPKINYAITGINWGLKKEINEEEVPQELRAYYRSELEKFINLYHLKKRTEIDSLIREIENSRLYFNFNSSELTRHSEKALTNLILKIQKLESIIADSASNMIIEIHGHNGSSEDAFRAKARENSETRLKLLACDRAIQRAEFISALLSQNYNSTKIIYATKSLSQFRNELNSYYKSGEVTSSLIGIINEVMPFELIEQSVTFKVGYNQ